jgi:hypothetical protein
LVGIFYLRKSLPLSTFTTEVHRLKSIVASEKLVRSFGSTMRAGGIHRRVLELLLANRVIPKAQKRWRKNKKQGKHQ